MAIFDHSVTNIGNSTTVSVSGTPSFLAPQIAIVASAIVAVGGGNIQPPSGGGWTNLLSAGLDIGNFYMKSLPVSGPVTVSESIGPNPTPWSAVLGFFGSLTSASPTSLQQSGTMGGGSTSPNTTYTGPFGSNITAGNSILVGGSFHFFGPIAGITISDNQNNTYQFIGSAGVGGGGGSGDQVFMYAAFNCAAGPTTVSFRYTDGGPSGGATGAVIAAEITGLGPLQLAVKAQHLYDYRNNAQQDRTLIATAADGTGVLSATNDVIYWDVNGAGTTIFTPSAGATAPRAANSRDYEYFTDGIAADELAWTITSGTSKWGIAAPVTAAGVAATSGGGSSSGVWSANTEFSTMGILVDTNNNIEQLVSINANNNNSSTTLGTTSAGEPAWNQTTNGTTADGTLTWTNRGPVGLWAASSTFSNSDAGGTLAAPGIIFDPSSNGLFQVISGSVSSGTVRPPFAATAGWTYTESTGLRWTYTGQLAPGQQWANSTFYPHAGAGNSLAFVIEPVSVTKAYSVITNTFTQTVYGQWVTNPGGGGTSSASFASPAWQPYVDSTHQKYVWDKQAIWLNLGTANWAAGTPVQAWVQGSTNFTAIKDTNGNIQVCITSGTTAGAHPVWGIPYGTVTNETSGTAQWACVGTSLSWAASTQWFLPLTGFTAPQSTSSFGGASITDSNTNLETVINSGKSGGTTPAWASPGSNTTDGTITWYDVEAITPGAGTITLTTPVGRRYYVVYLNSIKQNFSDLSPISSSTGPITNGQIALFSLPISADTQVDSKVILATADGGDPLTLYFVGQVSNNVTTFNDNTPEQVLLLNNIYQQEDADGNSIGVVGNDPPPANGSFPTVHKGRMWLAKNNLVYYSKSISDVTTSSGIIAGRYEEDWPPANAIDITPGAEFISGLLSDGYSLFIATERHVRKLSGSTPSEFGLPSVAFSEAGVLSQDVWKVVFLEGTPVGCMWLTPDFRVVGSDFNTYNDVGTSIQSTLNTINIAATSVAWAESITYGAYNFYILAIPTGVNTTPDTWCVYDMHLRKWYLWTFSQLASCGIFYFSLAGIARFLIVTSDGLVKFIDPAQVQDIINNTGPVTSPIVTTIRTGWLHMGDPAMRKTLNEIEVVTSDTGMLITLEGASTASDFQNPNLIFSNLPLTTNIFGQLKTFTSGYPSIYRFYRFTFTSTSSVSSSLTDVILGYFSAEVLPLNRI